MEFKNRIKILRQSKNISLTDLGAVLGKTESACRAWELGRTKPDVDTLIQLADYFNCTTDYLLGLSKYRNKEEIKCLLKLEESQQEILDSLNGNYKQKYLAVNKNILVSFMVTQNDEDPDGELFTNYTDFLQYISAFYNTRYALYPTEIFGEITDYDSALKTRIIAAFEIKGDIDNLVRDLLGIPENTEIDKQFSIDFERYKAWIQVLVQNDKNE